MKNYLHRLQKLEELLKRKDEPVATLIQEKEKIDYYYWNKLFRLLTKKELQNFTNIEENKESLKQLNELIAMYETQVLKLTLSPGQKARIDEFNLKLSRYPEQKQIEIAENKTEFANKFWDEVKENIKGRINEKLSK